MVNSQHGRDLRSKSFGRGKWIACSAVQTRVSSRLLFNVVQIQPLFVSVIECPFVSACGCQAFVVVLRKTQCDQAKPCPVDRWRKLMDHHASPIFKKGE